MIYAFTKVSKKISPEGDISADVQTINLDSLQFEELLNFDGTPNELAKEITKYKNLHAKKRVQGAFLEYQRVLSREITQNYTSDQKTGDVQAIEDRNPFLVDPSLIPEYNDKRLNKLMHRKKIKTGVRDTDDSVADLAKWISLVTSMNFTIYNALSATAKSNIPAQERELIELCQSIFKNTETVGDLSLAREGGNLIQKIMNREKTIAQIINGEI